MPLNLIRADKIKLELPPRCPTCGAEMRHYGGSAGYICCGWKLLYRGGGWFDGSGAHVADERINPMRVDGVTRRASA
jgi:hypothetical protein